ncbi:MAG TPA: hypothetical protein VJO35_09125 [Terriglobales bacterium]|nr:hypothetical protein [Terriglobales bacterium]
MSIRTKLMLLAAVLFPALPLFAQSCPLCYTQAASSGPRLIAALRSGILVLIIPPMFMSVGITWLAYRKRNQFRPNPEAGNTASEKKDEFDD